MEDKYFQTDTEINAWALGGVTRGKHHEVKVSLICYFRLLEDLEAEKPELHFISHHSTQHNASSPAFVPLTLHDLTSNKQQLLDAQCMLLYSFTY